MTKPAPLHATPTYPTGTVTVQAPDAIGRLCTMHVTRWATDHLDVEAWSVHRTALAAALLPATVRHEWHTTPMAACARALNPFTIAGHGAPPCAPDTLLRHPIRPTTTTKADRITPP